MSESLRCIYVTYTHAAVRIREQVSLNSEDILNLSAIIMERNIAREFLILSTCNRTELFYLSKEDKKDELIPCLLQYKGLDEFSGLASHFTSLGDSAACILRLFEISNGLKSQVLGDFQIIKQVKDAYELGNQSGSVGSYFHRLIQLILASHKDISTYTRIHSGNASISSASVGMIESIVRNEKDRSILVVGAGKFSREVIEQLEKRGYNNIHITNRNEEKALDFSKEYQLKFIPYALLSGELDYDVIITCVSSPAVLIKEKQIKNKRALLVDLSVPRAIDPELGEKKGFRLLNMDHMEELNKSAVEKRQEAVPKAMKIVQSYVEEFMEWEVSNVARPVLNEFKNAIEEIRTAEIQRFLRKSKDNLINEDVIDKLTKNMVNKIVKIPALRLAETSRKSGVELDLLCKALSRLFDLAEAEKTNPA